MGYRPTKITINTTALLHNLNRVRALAPGKSIIAMVKANAYGCGLSSVVPVLDGRVDAFGVACLEEAIAIRTLGGCSECILFQGVFHGDEWHAVANYGLQSVIHHEKQLQSLLNTPLSKKIKIWVKVDTGMHRLGFLADDVPAVITALQQCPWVDASIGLMTHLANADEPFNDSNITQLLHFNALSEQFVPALRRTIANSAAIIALPSTHADAVRPGIMLYGVSPFADKTGAELGLMPVMHLVSAISSIHQYPPNSPIGYGSTWQRGHPTIIGTVPVGYGDGYPRHIAANSVVFINGGFAPIVGRVSMDLLTVDLTACVEPQVNDAVELWGQHVPIETVAQKSGTIAYELLCQVQQRVYAR